MVVVVEEISSIIDGVLYGQISPRTMIVAPQNDRVEHAVGECIDIRLISRVQDKEESIIWPIEKIDPPKTELRGIWKVCKLA